MQEAIMQEVTMEGVPGTMTNITAAAGTEVNIGMATIMEMGVRVIVEMAMMDIIGMAKAPMSTVVAGQETQGVETQVVEEVIRPTLFHIIVHGGPTHWAVPS